MDFGPGSQCSGLSYALERCKVPTDVLPISRSCADRDFNASVMNFQS